MFTIVSLVQLEYVLVLRHYFSFLIQEIQNIRAMVVHNAKRVLEVLNSLPGFSCQPVKGGSFVFPRLHLPPGAVKAATVRIL